MIKNHLPSNCYASRIMKSVDGAAVHFISAKNVKPDNPFDLDAILGILKDYKFSATYLIRRSGEQIELVPDLHVAYHAGYSRMNGRDDCNEFTIGIELEGGTDWEYPDEQILSLAELLAQLMTKHNFTFDWVKGHDEIRSNWIAEYPDKAAKNKVPVKVDPGDHFPWDTLREMLEGVSINA